MSLRTRRAMGLLALVSVLASACGPAVSPAPATNQGASAAPSAAPADGASADLRFAISGEPTYFSPASSDPPTAWVNHLIYTGLYRVDNTGDVVPDLATAMPEIGTDGITLTIRMRTDATWHDGSPVSSADARFTFRLAMSSACTFNPATCATWGDNVASVEAPTPDTLVITMKKKYAPIYGVGLTQGLVPKAATEASYARFVAGSAAVDAAAVKVLTGRISAARRDEACATAVPPDTCGAPFYQVDMEAIVASAGIALPDPAGFVGVDGTINSAAYGDALLAQLTDLDVTLRADEPDRLAAAYRLLDINRNPVGSGAYRFVGYTPGQGVELARNDNYYLFRPGPARVLALVIPDAAAASQALQSGDIDWQPGVTSSEARALASNPGIRVSEYADFSYVYLGFNVRPGHAFSDIVARRAFGMCIDHAATVQAATEGAGVPVKGNIPPGSYFYDPSVPDYRLDVAGARKLLEANGYVLREGVYEKDGNALRADLSVRRDQPQRVQFALLAKEQLARCGIDIAVRESEYATEFVPLLYYPNDFDIILGSWGDLADPDDSRFFSCASVTSKGNPYAANATGYCDPALDALQEAAARELDRGARRNILAKVQRFLHDKGPYYFLWTELGHRAYSASVTTNGALGPIDYASFYDWWNMDSWVITP